VCTVAEAAIAAVMPDYLLLRPVLLELKRQNPEPEHGPAALDDPELRGWLCWASEGGNVPSFVGRVVGCSYLRLRKRLRPAAAGAA
jgi:hypothetical protein